MGWASPIPFLSRSGVQPASTAASRRMLRLGTPTSSGNLAAGRSGLETKEARKGQSCGNQKRCLEAEIKKPVPPELLFETGRTNREPLTLLFKPMRNHFGGATSEIESLNHQAEQTERLGCWIEEDSVIMQI